MNVLPVKSGQNRWKFTLEPDDCILNGYYKVHDMQFPQSLEVK